MDSRLRGNDGRRYGDGRATCDPPAPQGARGIFFSGGESGEVVLTVQSEALSGDRVRLTFSIRDTGIGLTPEGMGRLFQSFSQADSSTTRKYGGTGLGLSISRELSRLLGGELRVESEPGQGSTFSFAVVTEEAPEVSARLRVLVVSGH